MDEGAIMKVLIFPSPWPPSTERQLVSRRESDTLLTLTADLSAGSLSR